jgi:hypothetical protein
LEGALVPHRLVQRLSRRWYALRQGKPFGAFCAGIVLAFLFGKLLGDGRAAFRYAGTILQLFGLVLVGHDLIQTGRLFRRPSIVTRAAGWLGQVFGPARPAHVVGAFIASGAQLHVGGGTVRVVVHRKNASIEERMREFEAELKTLRIDLEAEIGRASTGVNALEKAVLTEKDARETQAREFDTRFREFALGGYDQEWIGFAWLFIATILTAC